MKDSSIKYCDQADCNKRATYAATGRSPNGTSAMIVGHYCREHAIEAYEKWADEVIGIE